MKNIDLEPTEYRADIPNKKEPILGPNAKPLAAQFIVGLVAFAAASWAVNTYLDEPIGRFICFYITGSCS